MNATTGGAAFPSVEGGAVERFLGGAKAHNHKGDGQQGEGSIKGDSEAGMGLSAEKLRTVMCMLGCLPKWERIASAAHDVFMNGGRRVDTLCMQVQGQVSPSMLCQVFDMLDEDKTGLVDASLLAHAPWKMPMPKDDIRRQLGDCG